ncbi:MAG: hypothetical protein APF84_02415 [Gracilibacter sp. BRH_c7a]|nr:MAG: hypothetical protein APF84_02415 [Gracilibacter sp. BRH_c7a]
MKAMVLEKFNSSLCLKEVNDPAPGKGEVLIRVHTCGTCGSDLKISSGKISTTSLPHILGHEVAGQIVQCGDEVPPNRIGERVALHIYNSCGNCKWCVKGNYNLCTNLRGRIGFENPGGFAELVIAPARNAVVIPDNISYKEASLVPCAMLAIYRAINRAKVEDNDRVAMLGVGGLGIHGIQFLRLLGVDITAIDINLHKLEFAKSLGADKALLFEEFITDNGVYDVIFDNVGAVEVTKKCLTKLNKNGRYVMVAYSPGINSSFDSEYMHLNETQIIGSRNGSIEEFIEIMNLLSSGRVKAVIDSVLDLDQADQALSLTREGKAVGRVILKI